MKRPKPFKPVGPQPAPQPGDWANLQWRGGSVVVRNQFLAKIRAYPAPMQPVILWPVTQTELVAEFNRRHFKSARYAGFVFYDPGQPPLLMLRYGVDWDVVIGHEYGHIVWGDVPEAERNLWRTFLTANRKRMHTYRAQVDNDAEAWADTVRSVCDPRYVDGIMPRWKDVDRRHVTAFLRTLRPWTRRS